MLFEKLGKKKTLDLIVEGMHCEKCVEKVVKVIKELGGSAIVDLATGKAKITCPEVIDTKVIIEAIKKLGFDCKAE